MRDLPPDPASRLPHRPPFLLLSRIVSLSDGVSGEALLPCACDDALCGSGGASLPPILLVEAMAQLAGIVAGGEKGGGGLLAAIDRALFHEAPRTGDAVTVRVRIARSFGDLHLAEGTASAGERLLAEATLSLRSLPPGGAP
jgi:3-hydroxyacyl-[acyl-carrier-protein] dehydratase